MWEYIKTKVKCWYYEYQANRYQKKSTADKETSKYYYDQYYATRKTLEPQVDTKTDTETGVK